MKTFDFIQSAISHHLKDPHSKALEPDCLFPLLAIMTQSPAGEELIFSLNCVNIMMLYCAGDRAPAAFGGRGMFRSSAF